MLGGHLLSTYGKFFRKTNISNISNISTCAYQEVRNNSFSENFAYVLNGWPLDRFITNVSNQPVPTKIKSPFSFYKIVPAGYVSNTNEI